MRSVKKFYTTILTNKNGLGGYSLSPFQRVKQCAEQGYTSAVLVDLPKYFDTLNHELLMNLLRKNVHDKRVIELIKRYLKAGVMENGLLVKTTERLRMQTAILYVLK